MYELAKRLKLARKMTGMSMQDLADASKLVTKQSINKYEKGLMKPTEEVLVEISKALDVRMDYFKRKGTLELGEVKYRKQSRLSKKKQNEITEKTRDFLERYFEAEELLNDHANFDEQLRNISLDSKEDVEKIALQIRTKWNLGTKSIYNILEILEQNGIRVLYLNEEIQHFSGMSTWVNNSIPVIALGKTNIDRLRFTALHELAHLILKLDHLEDTMQERICDRFAGAMLIPKEELLIELGGNRKKVSLAELCIIKAEYGISPQALLYRSRQLGYIPERFFTSQTKLYRSRGLWKKELGNYSGEEKPNRFTQLIYRGIAEEYLTKTKAATLLGITVEKLRAEINSVYGISGS